jgi:site-specific DNA recombinase
MTPTHTRKGSRLYRYYVSTDTVRGRDGGAVDHPLARMPADLVERATVQEMLRLVRAPEPIAEAIRLVRSEEPEIAEAEIITALDEFWSLWATLIPAEQARLIRLLVDRVVVRGDAIAITLRAAGLGQIAREMLAGAPVRRAA